jgi:phosphoribosylformylglycinamidine synthase subunit PurS
MIQVRIRIMPKDTILDPQGQTVLHALDSLGFDQASSCRMGKFVILDFPDMDREELEKEVKSICRRLLVNHNTESWDADYVEMPEKHGSEQ